MEESPVVETESTETSNLFELEYATVTCSMIGQEIKKTPHNSPAVQSHPERLQQRIQFSTFNAFKN